MAVRLQRRLKYVLAASFILIILYLTFSRDVDISVMDPLGSATQGQATEDPFKESTRTVDGDIHPKIKEQLDEPVEQARPVPTEPAKVSTDQDLIPTSYDTNGFPEVEKPKPSMKPFDLNREEKYPVSPKRMKPLPAGVAVKIPTIQATAPSENAAQKHERLRRMEVVRETMRRDWQGYKQYAWGHDEIKPVSKTVRNPFGSWGATLVDSLDTLLIMGLFDEYKEAAEAVAKIDFTRKSGHGLPVFETTIRYLGGLLAAHDLSAHYGIKDDIMLKQAKILGRVLYGAFDTPNRMPILHYNWDATSTEAEPIRAPANGIMSEIGSLSVELTRLAQLSTGENRDKYYDAVARVTDAMEASQDDMAIPGLWPTYLDMSGCAPQYSKSAHDYGSGSKGDSMQGTLVGKREDKSEDLLNNAHMKQGVNDNGLPVLLSQEPFKCREQGLKPTADQQDFSLGGLADSTYEYFTKEYLLLGGVKEAEQYKRLYERSAEAAKKHILFRPLVPGDLDILLPGDVRATAGGEPHLLPRMQHLSCFVGGMFGLGAKVFQRPEDMEIAIKLTNGCVWAYGATDTGIMPETFTTVECKTETCSWAARMKALKKDFDKQHESNDPEWVSALSAGDASGNAHAKRMPPPLDQSEAQRLQRKAVSDAERRTSHPAARLLDQWEEPSPMHTYSTGYGLRPEAIESVWYMWRLTGDRQWQEKGWKMWQAVEQHTRTEAGHSSIHDVFAVPTYTTDFCESFWFAETLKYFFLLFADFDVISLDEFVLNTEAHPFKRMQSK